MGLAVVWFDEMSDEVNKKCRSMALGKVVFKFAFRNWFRVTKPTERWSYLNFKMINMSFEDISSRLAVGGSHLWSALLKAVQ